jgi:MFS family permease
VRHAFRALRSRNYKIFFIGQGVSLVGTWMQSVAMSWLVYRLTGSATLLGLTAFAALVPGFLLGPYAGVMVDRLDKRRLLMITQSVMMVQAAVLAGLTFAGLVEVWHILVLSVVLGIAGAFDMPARQATMVHLVEDRQDLGNAIALNSSQFNLARLIGPAIGGFVVELTSEAVAFSINAVSYLAVLLALFALVIPPEANPLERGRVKDQIREGAQYVLGSEPIKALIALLAVISFLNGAQSVLLPVLAAKTYSGDAGTLGILQAAVGLGALVSALMLASKSDVLGLGKWLVWSSSLFGVAVFFLGFSRVLPIGLLLLTLLGAGAMTHMAATNTLVQTLVEDRMRGRVMSFYVMAFTGTMPFGSLLAGWLAERLGIGVVLAGVGLMALIASIVFSRSLPRLRDVVRPIYVEKGILKVS